MVAWFHFRNASWARKKGKLLRYIHFFCIAPIDSCYKQNQYKGPNSGILMILTCTLDTQKWCTEWENSGLGAIKSGPNSMMQVRRGMRGNCYAASLSSVLPLSSSVTTKISTKPLFLTFSWYLHAP